MLRITLLVALLIVGAAPTARAETPTDLLFSGIIAFCKATGEDAPLVGYRCPEKVTKVEDCTRTGAVTGEQRLAACVSSRLTKDEQAAWATSQLNPTRAAK